MSKNLKSGDEIHAKKLNKSFKKILSRFMLPERGSRVVIMVIRDDFWDGIFGMGLILGDPKLSRFFYLCALFFYKKYNDSLIEKNKKE